MHGYHKKSDIGTHTYYIAWTSSSVVCKSAVLSYLASSTLADMISVEARRSQDLPTSIDIQIFHVNI